MEIPSLHYQNPQSSGRTRTARFHDQRIPTRPRGEAEVSPHRNGIYSADTYFTCHDYYIPLTQLGWVHDLPASSRTNNHGASSTFFSLPVELRIQIYNLVLPDSPRIRFSKELLPKASAVHQPFGAKPHRHRYHIPALLQTSRQLRSEAAGYYFSSPDLVLEIESDELSEFLRFMTSDRRYIAPLHRGMLVSNPAVLIKVTGHLSWKNMRLLLDWLTTSVPAALEWRIEIQRGRECCRLEQHLASVEREAGDAMEVARVAGSLVKQTELGVLRRQMLIAKKLRWSLRSVV